MQEIEELIAEFKSLSWRGKPFEHMTAIITRHPDRVRELVERILVELEESGTFLDAALSFLPEIEWDSVVALALEQLEENPDHESAASVIAYASLQCPESLHSHLDRIWHLKPNGDPEFGAWPWRESGHRHLSFLQSIAMNAADDQELKTAWECALQTRNREVIEALEVDWDEIYFHEVALDREGGWRSLLIQPDPFHLIFPPDYPGDKPDWLKPIPHPTWSLSAHGPEGDARIGGLGTGNCGHCGGSLHLLLGLDDIPVSLGITELTALSLETCLSCLGWEARELFYRHDAMGRPKALNGLAESKTPQFPSKPLLPSRVQLTRHSRRWCKQDWAQSNNRENLHRLGGEPCWVQSAGYPRCPQCERLMPFLLQLDSDLPKSEDRLHFWGSGGLGYCFWCDACKISAWYWQCT